MLATLRRERKFRADERRTPQSSGDVRSLNPTRFDVIDVNGDRLDAQFLNASGGVARRIHYFQGTAGHIVGEQPVTMEQGATRASSRSLARPSSKKALPVALTIAGSATAGRDYLPIANPGDNSCRRTVRQFLHRAPCRRTF
jgi:hypothetical protein